MRDILDPADTWIGTPAGVSFSSNKAPVALDDTLNVLMNGGPVTVSVLANDLDPEGQPLTLVSASAALGTAVAEADNTVTYTPPPGISGFDTVIYEVSDDLGQTRSAQINVTISEPQLSISTEPDNTLVVNAETGTVDITVTTPVQFAGTWQIATADLAGGPLNLVAPAIGGTAAAGQNLTAEAGLWVYDAGAGQPVRSWQWRRGGSDIPGETGPTYSVVAGDIGPGLSVMEIQTDTAGQGSAVSPVVGTSFTPAGDAQLIGWWDADDAATITAVAGLVSAWADKSGGIALGSTGSQQPQSGMRFLNGRNVIDFDGSNLMERAETFPASGNIAFHIACEIDSTSNMFEALLSVEAVNDFQIDANNATQFDGRLNMTGIGNPASFAGAPLSGAFILSVVFDRTGTGTAECFVSGASRVTAPYNVAIDSSAALHLMTNRSKNAWVDGAVAELVITGDITNRAQHHAYMAAKWGLA